MASIITDLREVFRRGNIYIRLIFINAAVFVLTAGTAGLMQLFYRERISMQWLDSLRLPASFDRLMEQPWSLLTYMFMHVNFWHLLFNMLWLYWFGALFLRFFSAKHLRGLYLLGGIGGGLLYMVAYNVFPYFADAVGGALMVGASASVLAIVAAVAWREPNYPIPLLLFGTVRLKWLALVVIGGEILFVTADNPGGHIAHLGGALAGLWFAASLAKGHDLTAWINRAIDGVYGLFRPRPRKPKMKVRYGTGRQKDYDYNAARKVRTDEIDRILDKLKKSGYGSLTAEEKKRLFDESKR